MKHVLLTVVFLGIACVAMAHELLSPNGNLKLNVVLDSEGGPVYSLYYKGEPVVEPSALGILMEEADLSNGFRILDATNSTFDETWMPVWGEYEKVRNHYNELTVTFSQPAKHDRTMIVRFRLFDDGLGFRYELPEQKTMNYLTVKDELTEFNLTGNHTLYCIPGDYDTNEFAYTTAAISEVREAMERNLRKKGYEAKATSFTVQTPLMIKTTEGLYINIHEAALVDYSAMLLNVDDKEFNFSAHLTPDKLGKKGYLQLPLHTPWRTIMVSDDARSILASQLILNLNEPCKLEDTSWIKPQKFIGVWWEMFTASGGPFRTCTMEQLTTVTKAQALKHPNWDMGAKITIDSASMMNKGFEVIEAKWLFGVRPDQIEVVVHPQSVIHSMVQFEDGAVKAQLGMPDMRLPIQYAFSYPDRLKASFPRLDFKLCTELTFEQPDTTRFRNLALAYEALHRAGNMPCIVNAANEVVVAAFLQDKISFLGMSEVIEKTMSRVSYLQKPTYEDYVATDAEARRIAEELI